MQVGFDYNQKYSRLHFKTCSKINIQVRTKKFKLFYRLVIIWACVGGFSRFFFEWLDKVRSDWSANQNNGLSYRRLRPWRRWNPKCICPFSLNILFSIHLRFHLHIWQYRLYTFYLLMYSRKELNLLVVCNLKFLVGFKIFFSKNGRSVERSWVRI